ncbi:MAG TPA: FAD-binding protein [Acidimicrobiia bacterium]
MTDTAASEVCAAIRGATAVHVVGAGTHDEIGGRVDARTEVRAASGIVRFEPADMTVRVRAGTPVRELEAALAERGQECVLDPRSPDATVGGVLATGLSGWRRLRHGPVRDVVLEVRFATGDGRVVRGGGPTVKNVTGYDIPRLMVGSMGTLGVLLDVTLRTRPLAEATAWAAVYGTVDEVPAALYRPSCVASDGGATHVLLEGDARDVDEQQRAAGLRVSDPPRLPEGRHRGRASVAPGNVPALRARLREIPVRWLAEVGVGTVHVGADRPEDLASARAAAERLGGWMLREHGAPDLDPFGIALPNAGIMARIKAALDPDGRLNPDRLPLNPASEAA